MTSLRLSLAEAETENPHVLSDIYWHENRWKHHIDMFFLDYRLVTNSFWFLIARSYVILLL